jgi:type II secretion system protein N
MPELSEVLTLDYLRERGMVLSYAIVALVLFVIFMIGTFPYQEALTGALMPLGLEIAATSERPAIPLGAVLENVRLISLDHPSAPPIVQSESLKLTPALGMLIGRPAVNIRADMYGGRVWASVSRRGDITGLALDLSNIDLSRYPTSPSFAATIKGIVSGTASFENLGPTINSQNGAFTLEGHDLEYGLIKGFPPLRFSHLKTTCRLDQATLRVNALEGTGPDMTVSGSGVIHLGPTLALSMIEMTMRIMPTVAGRARLGMLFAFLPHPPDNRPYVFHGPLLMPQAN